MQPTARAAHGPKLHSHGPLTNFRCRFVCGITSQKKSYQTCPAAFGLGGLEQHLWGGGRCGEHLHAGQAQPPLDWAAWSSTCGEAGAVVSTCMQGRSSAAVKALIKGEIAPDRDPISHALLLELALVGGQRRVPAEG